MSFILAYLRIAEGGKAGCNHQVFSGCRAGSDGGLVEVGTELDADRLSEYDAVIIRDYGRIRNREAQGIGSGIIYLEAFIRVRHKQAVRSPDAYSSDTPVLTDIVEIKTFAVIFVITASGGLFFILSGKDRVVHALCPIVDTAAHFVLHLT